LRLVFDSRRGILFLDSAQGSSSSGHRGAKMEGSGIYLAESSGVSNRFRWVGVLGSFVGWIAIGDL